MPGGGRLILTGQLGEVMKESAQAALTYVRSVSDRLGASERFFQKHDIHVHVPAGAVPKDGPSAGVAMAVALASMVSGKVVDPEAAMTGEITLTGQVLPVGGIKEKVLAARAAGLTKVFLPSRNEADVDDIEEEDLLSGIEFVYVDHVSTALEGVLGLEEPLEAPATALDGRAGPATGGVEISGVAVAPASRERWTVLSPGQVGRCRERTSNSSTLPTSSSR